MTPIELVEKWSEEINIKNISWHELSLLKSFALWMMQGGLTPRAVDFAGTCSKVNHFYVGGACARCGQPEPQSH